MKNVLTLCFIVCACFMVQTNLSAQADPGCPELTIDANSFGFPSSICVGEALEICIDATDGGSDLGLITLTGVAVTGGPDPGFAIVPNPAAGQICISTTPLPGPDPCAPYNLDISLLGANISSTDPTCASGNVAITVIGGPPPLPDPFMTNDINGVLPLLGVAGLDPLTVTIYPSYDIVVTAPDCSGVAGSAMLMAGADVCQTVAGTAGMENVCPDVLDTDAALTYDFTADIDPLACVTGTITDNITVDCAVACCAATASTISTTDPTRICIDGVGDPIDVTFDVAGMGGGAWVITDANAIILDLPMAPPFDLNGAGPGQCLIWYVNVDDATFNPMIGDDAAALVAASSCAFLSNPITVDRIEVTAPTISTTDPTTICIDGVGDPINVTTDDAGIGANSAWVITDAAGIILDLPAGPPFDLDGAGAGTCLIWLVNYDDPNFAPAVGDDATAVVTGAACAVLSNSITVERTEITAPAISTTDMTTICVDDGIDDFINVTIDDAGTGGTATAWVITDAMGIIVDLPPAPPFNLEGAGAGTCLIWLVSTNDGSFAPAVGDDAAAAVAAATCATLSNSIAVTRQTNCAACTAATSTISTTDPTRICIDGVGDPINVNIDVDGGATGTWVITDAAATILALPPGPPFDLDGAGAGQCLIWYVNSDDAAFNPMVGDDAAAAVAASSCAFLSNSITVDRIEVTPPTISTTDPTTICIDGVGDPINVTTDDAGIGANSAWVITDAAGIILDLPAGPPFDLDGAGAGTCLIWLVNYEDPNFAPAVGDDAAAIVTGAACAALSNSITVERTEITAPAISTTDPLVICADDGIDDLINVTVDDPGTGGTATAWVITDAMGMILALPPAPPFNLEGAGGGTCLIWLVSTNDGSFAPAVGDDAAAAVAAATCATLSNSIAVTRQTNCAACTAATSTISTTDPTRICIDGVGDPINVNIDVDGGATGTWVITDAAATILALPPGPPFDLDGAGAGQCLIWYVNSDDAAFNPMVGDDAAAAVAASSCAFLSNSITVDRIEVTAPTISTTDPTDICADDGIDDLITPTVDAAGIGANAAWVITDATGTILALPPAPPFNLEGAGAGTCLIWLVNYDDPNFAPTVGADAAAAVAASTCAVLSNSIAVTRAVGCGVCEEEITYTVSAPGCDMTGAAVELFDAGGVSLGMMALGANGGSGSFGIQSCGDYSLVITGAPACYTNEGGDVGPRMFTIDGSGTTLETFTFPITNIPTVGEWGLIILGLMMSITAVVGIRQRRREEIYG